MGPTAAGAPRPPGVFRTEEAHLEVILSIVGARSRLYADRAVGRDRDHCRTDRAVAPSGTVGPRGGARAQCVNNLKQIGLAVYNYEAAGGSYPMGNITQSWFDDPNCGGVYYGHTAMSYILPYIEGSNQYNAINYSLPYNRFGQTTAFYTKVASYICPTDGSAVSLPAAFIATAQTSYAPVRGIRENIFWTQAGPNASNRCGANDSEGLFGVNISYRIAEVTDGTSNTMMFGETSRFKEEESGSSHFSFWNVAAAWVGPPWTAAAPSGPVTCGSRAADLSYQCSTRRRYSTAAPRASKTSPPRIR